MKKIFKYLFIVVLIFLVNDVYALSFNTYFKTTNSAIYENGDVKVTIGVKNATNLYGLRASLNYDSSKLTFVSAQGLNNFGVEVGTYFVADSSSPVNGTKDIATLYFKATSNFKIGEKTTISLGTGEGSDGDNLMTSSSSAVTISVIKPKNSNVYLKNLSVSEGSLTFNKNTTSYKVIVDNKIEEITINATAEESTSRVSGTGKKYLEIYSNFYNIVVTSESGSQKTYTVEVIRKDEDGNAKELSNINTLEVLEVKDYPFVFNNEISEYTILLNNNKKLDINTKATDENSSITIKEPDNYNKGNNEIIIEVVSERGEKREYKINAILLNVKDVVNAPVKKDNNNVIIIILIIIYIITLIAGIILYKKDIIKINKKH